MQRLEIRADAGHSVVPLVDSQSASLVAFAPPRGRATLKGGGLVRTCRMRVSVEPWQEWRNGERKQRGSWYMRQLITLGLVAIVLASATPVWSYRSGNFLSGIGVGRGGGTRTTVSRSRGGAQRSTFRRSSHVQRRGGQANIRSRRHGPRALTLAPSGWRHRPGRHRGPRIHPRKVWLRGRWLTGPQEILTVSTESYVSAAPPRKRQSSSDSGKVWVQGRWEKTSHGVLMWRTGHWATPAKSSP